MKWMIETELETVEETEVGVEVEAQYADTGAVSENVVGVKVGKESDALVQENENTVLENPVLLRKLMKKRKENFLKSPKRGENLVRYEHLVKQFSMRRYF